MDSVSYLPLSPQHFDQVIELGNKVHGENYLDQDSTNEYFQMGLKAGINASWVALRNKQLVGFRLTWAAGNWQLDKWCSPQKWQLPEDKVCYFKCNTVDESCRGLGIGSKLLALSIEQAKQQGALAGLAHIWLASPGNSAFKYFTKSGGEMIAEHPNKWRQLCIDDDYQCTVCNDLCSCVAGEMMIRF